ncbi:MAG: hypothetical protein QMD61_09910 [Methanobacterium sp.]|nr:hypothetical protein [Methanobacterium sp.]
MNLNKSHNLEPKSRELRKTREIELIIDEYIMELVKNGEINDLFQFNKEMANIIMFLAENDRDGTLFTFITDYLKKIIDKGKVIRQEKGI